MDSICIKKIPSVRDPTAAATVEIIQGVQGHSFFIIHYTSYELVNGKPFVFCCRKLDRETVAAHFPGLEKYVKWQGVPIYQMEGFTRQQFFLDMAELFSTNVSNGNNGSSKYPYGEK